jgi:hypothetical protein
MKEAASVLLLTVLIFSGSIPLMAQNRGASASSQAGQKQAATGKKNSDSTSFDSADAFTDGNGVWVRWRMNQEVNSEGFYLYRIDNYGRNLVTDNFTLGAGYRSREIRTIGRQYSTFDPEGTANATYEIENVSLDGSTTATMRVSPKSVSDISTVTGNSSTFFQSKSSPESFSITSTAQALPYDLASQVSSFQAAPDPNKQKLVASLGGVKIGIKNAGIYRVTFAQLQAAGFDTGSNTTNWQLFTDGIEQAITINTTGGYVEFYGKPIDAPEADTRTYYLILGASAGKRIATRLSRAGLSTVVSQAYDQTSVNKERTVYIPDVLNGDAENYWGRPINTTGTTKSFNLSGVPTSGSVIVTFSALGFSSTAHSINLTLNNNFIGTLTGFSNLAENSIQIPIQANLLLEGSNSLKMQSTVSGDLSWFDTFNIQYSRKYLASQNQLSFHTENFKIAGLDGFTSPNIRVFDTTIDGSPVLISNLSALQNGVTYGVSMPAAQSRVFFAVEDSGIQQAVSVSQNTPSSLSTTGHNASLVIISYPDFMNLPVDPTCVAGSANYPGCLPPARQWAVYRQGQGTSVEVVNIDDVYDEFNYGAPSPNAVRDFLAYAKNNWQTPPRYVLLMGDGSNDPKNYTGFGYFNFVPPKSINTNFGEAPSDDGLVDFNNDGLAEMAIGRIPARKSATILDVLNKVKVFESSGKSLKGSGALMSYDKVTSTDTFFLNMSQTLAGNMPSAVAKTYISRLDTNATLNLIASINSGKYIINYSGHGSGSAQGYTLPRLLANTDLYTLDKKLNDNVPTLTNTTAPSVVVSLSCLNGFFVDPQIGNVSIGELLLSLGSGDFTVASSANTGGGAVAVWASTAETTTDVQQVMGNEFYKQVGLGTLAGNSDPRLGDFILDAKTVIPFGTDVRLSWALLGDPMLKLKAQ